MSSFVAQTVSLRMIGQTDSLPYKNEPPCGGSILLEKDGLRRSSIQVGAQELGDIIQ